MTLAPPPRATYRLQFNESFRLDDARRIVSYLAALGVSHVYASPLLMARPGSTHGYDIVDHNKLNPEIGDDADFERLVNTLHEHGMGLILDFVPNHMGIGPDNPWWMDILEWGKRSPYADYFDIDWRPIEPTLADKILLPVLGDHYGAVLERGELELRLDETRGALFVTYFDTPFPLGPASYPPLLEAADGRAGDASRALAALAQAFRDALTGRAEGPRMRARQAIVASLKQRLAKLLEQEPGTLPAMRQAVRDLNGTAGNARSFDALHVLLEKQAWRLSFWRVAAHDMNYRRFFDINDLAALSMEQPELFAASHRLVGRLLREGSLQGVRLDHVDGLRDPRDYFDRLQSLADPNWRASRWRRHSRKGRRTLPLYVVVEKILAPHESLRRDWPVSGTSGYEFMAAVNGLFVDPAAKPLLERSYRRFVGRSLSFEEMRIGTKHLIMREALGSELNRLANQFNRLAKQSRETRDYSLTALRQALAEVAAHFPVYRTYVTGRETGEEDRRDIDWAVARARRSAPRSDTSVYDFIRDVLSLDVLGRTPPRHRRRDVVDAALKFQQFTGPVMAKAIEDTAFYRYACLVSLNEVGADPDRNGTTVAAFHELNRRRRNEFPDSMLATATHDHKRGEDARARLNVLSELPATWLRRVRRWAAFNERKRQAVDDLPAPDRNDEYLLYQTIVGAWPLALESPAFVGIESFRDRLLEYMRKAVREAKLRTSWASPAEAYEDALSRFVTDLFDPKLSRPFLEDVAAFVDIVAPAGAVNGLGQLVLKLTSPGVPDFYQGTEFWDLSLVDPDNRQPVDYAVRCKSLFDEIENDSCEALLAAWRDGRVKQFVIRRILAQRRDRPALFAEGLYRAIDVAGRHAERVLAFARVADDGECLVAVVPRLVQPILEPGAPRLRGWEDTSLAMPDEARAGRLFDILGDRAHEARTGRIPVGDILARFPVAVLRSSP